MSPRAQVSVILRSRDAGPALAPAIARLRAQRPACEVVVVDSGSRDGTIERARELADAVVLLESAYTPGRALNAGVRAAAGEVLCALSMHTPPPSPSWLETVLRHLADPAVGAVAGATSDADGQPLTGPLRLEGGDASGERPNPMWGLSNTASAWRREAWAASPFREDVPACEDKLFERDLLRAGWHIVFDPALEPAYGHRAAEGFRQSFRRNRLETAALHEHLALRPTPMRQHLHWFFRRMPQGSPPIVQAFSPHRTGRLAGLIVGERLGAWRGRGAR